MAELADAIDLGSIGNTVQVQVLSPAPYLCNKIDAHLEKLVFTSFFLRFEGKNFRCKTVDAFQRFSRKKGSRTLHNKNIAHNGRTLGVIPGVDDFHIVSEDSEPTEDEEMNISM